VLSNLISNFSPSFLQCCLVRTTKTQLHNIITFCQFLFHAKNIYKQLSQNLISITNPNQARCHVISHVRYHVRCHVRCHDRCHVRCHVIFLSELQLFGVSRSKKRLNIAENILNMEKFDCFKFHLRTFLHYTLNILMILIFFLNISASSNNFWEHCSHVPPLFAPMAIMSNGNWDVMSGVS
jgi:hypothetical protein